MPAPAAGRLGLAGAAGAAGAGIVNGFAPCMPAPAAGAVPWAQAGEAIASAAAIAKPFARCLGFIHFPPVGNKFGQGPLRVILALIIGSTLGSLGVAERHRRSVPMRAQLLLMNPWI